MLVEFTGGKIIVTAHEIVLRLDGENKVSMQAQTDAVQLIGQGANVILANGSECKWSVKLDSDEQLKVISEALGIAIL